MKRMSALLLAVLISVFMCSCSGIGVDVDDSISPPKLSGEQYDIQLALEKSIGSNIDLVYPSSGRYRSAIITKDVNGDGKIEAYAFYSSENDDKSVVMHINYVRWNGEEWLSAGDMQVDASGVESVEFAKLDSSLPKLIVHWSGLSEVSKLLTVYDAGGEILTEITSAKYSASAVCDFDGDGISSIITISLDAAAHTSVAKMMTFSDGVFIEDSKCNLDGTVTLYYEPKISKLTDGTAALFVDAEKSTGVLTEVLFLKNGDITSAFNLNAAGENVYTLRASSIRSADIDGDGNVEIPLAIRLPVVASTGATEATGAYMTVWNVFDGLTLRPVRRSVVNYTDGYSFFIPDEWINNYTVVRKTEISQRIFLRWDSATEKEGEEIMRIQAVKIKEWESEKDSYEGFYEIARNDKVVFVVKYGSSALNPGEEYMKKNFTVLQNTEE